VASPTFAMPYPVSWQVTDVRAAVDRRPMVLALGHEANVAQHHHRLISRRFLERAAAIPVDAQRSRQTTAQRRARRGLASPPSLFGPGVAGPANEGPHRQLGLRARGPDPGSGRTGVQHPSACQASPLGIRACHLALSCLLPIDWGAIEGKGSRVGVGRMRYGGNFFPLPASIRWVPRPGAGRAGRGEFNDRNAIATGRTRSRWRHPH